MVKRLFTLEYVTPDGKFTKLVSSPREASTIIHGEHRVQGWRLMSDNLVLTDNGYSKALVDNERWFNGFMNFLAEVESKS